MYLAKIVLTLLYNFCNTFFYHQFNQSSTTAVFIIFIFIVIFLQKSALINDI